VPSGIGILRAIILEIIAKEVSMSTYFRVGDEVRVVGCGQGRRIIRTLDGEHAVLEGEGGLHPLSELFFPYLTPELVARWMLAREDDDIPQTLAWVREDEANRRPSLVEHINKAIFHDGLMLIVVMELPAEGFFCDDRPAFAREIVEHLEKAIPSAL
jgi:hypothetical protein